MVTNIERNMRAVYEMRLQSLSNAFQQSLFCTGDGLQQRQQEMSRAKRRNYSELIKMKMLRKKN